MLPHSDARTRQNARCCAQTRMGKRPRLRWRVTAARGVLMLRAYLP